VLPVRVLLKSLNLSLNSAATFRAQLNGTNAGFYCSEQSVAGTVSLGNATLAATLGFNSAVSNKFTIIENDANDPVVGTFKNLPEGATLVISGAQFQISYQGGDGNDVVLTQISDVTLHTLMASKTRQWQHSNQRHRTAQRQLQRRSH